MSFIAPILQKFDRAMGIESAPCRTDDPQALALVKAGLGLLQTETEITLESRLSAMASAPELLKALKNLDGVYLQAANLSIGIDIIADVTVAELITHLDATKVNTLIDTMVAEERREASKVMHASLSDLETQINA